MPVQKRLARSSRCRHRPPSSAYDYFLFVFPAALAGIFYLNNFLKQLWVCAGGGGKGNSCGYSGGINVADALPLVGLAMSPLAFDLNEHQARQGFRCAAS